MHLECFDILYPTYNINCIYRYPSGNINIFFKQISQLLTAASNKYKHIYLCGDLNIHICPNNNHPKIL